MTSMPYVQGPSAAQIQSLIGHHLEKLSIHPVYRHKSRPHLKKVAQRPSSDIVRLVCVMQVTIRAAGRRS